MMTSDSDWIVDQILPKELRDKQNVVGWEALIRRTIELTRERVAQDIEALNVPRLMQFNVEYVTGWEDCRYTTANTARGL